MPNGVVGHAARIEVLDSFRALAALYVICYHYWYDKMDALLSDAVTPSMPLLVSSKFVQHGLMGVDLFFMISGFVIALTLSKSKSIRQFTVNRFARLFPAILVCSVLTFFVVKVLAVEPFSAVQAIDFLPSLTFMPPVLFEKLFGLNTNWISVVYWTLFVEVKFYFYAAAVYFLLPGKFLIRFFTLAFLLCTAYWIALAAGCHVVASLLGLVFFPEYAFLFVAGIAFHTIYDSNDQLRKMPISIIIFSLTYSLLIYSPMNPDPSSSTFAMLLILSYHLLFLLFVVDARILGPLKSALLVRIGIASYSLYLLHESIGLSIIQRLNEDIFPSSFWPFLVTAMMITLSLSIYKCVESPARRYIRRLN